MAECELAVGAGFGDVQGPGQQPTGNRCFCEMQAGGGARRIPLQRPPRSQMVATTMVATILAPLHGLVRREGGDTGGRRQRNLSSLCRAQEAPTLPYGRFGTANG
jgi:hypothetical protein